MSACLGRSSASGTTGFSPPIIPHVLSVTHTFILSPSHRIEAPAQQSAGTRDGRPLHTGDVGCGGGAVFDAELLIDVLEMFADSSGR